MAAAPEGAGSLLYGEFGVTSAEPLPGGVPLSEFMRELEEDANMAPRLERARQSLAEVLDQTTTLRQLRLKAGLSQSRLAERASTTQTYIARVEAGALDPGTDMLARLASALLSDEVTVFSAVRNQRSKQGAANVG